MIIRKIHARLDQVVFDQMHQLQQSEHVVGLVEQLDVIENVLDIAVDHVHDLVVVADHR